jgi:2,3-bisphosphoglycerate-independent phosphoglycerate mutase
MPHLHNLLGGPLVLGVGQDAISPNGLMLRAIDACLGVPGLPQSATGQTALFTGVNAAALVGEHITAYPTKALRDVIAQHSLLKRATKAGKRVLFANAHSERFWQMIRETRRRLGASTLTALAANAPIPTLADLREGRAVLWDITHEIASSYLGYELTTVSPEEAGARLARLAAVHDLVHGNVEDATTKSHTTNRVPLLTVGPAAASFRHATDITDVTPAILSSFSAKGKAGEFGPSSGSGTRG